MISDAQGLDAGIKMALLISVMKTKNCHPKIEDGTDLRILPLLGANKNLSYIALKGEKISEMDNQHPKTANTAW